MERDEVVRQGMEKLSQAQMDALGFAHDEGLASGDAAGYARGREESGSPVPEDTTPYDDAYVQEQLSKQAAEFAAREASLKEQLDALKAGESSVEDASEAIADEFRAMAAAFDGRLRALVQRASEPVPAPVVEGSEDSSPA